ncbi:MAG: hypothetical protein IPI28_00005 [Candidatus Omnitrophica bacterium]|nr:hypothetical protein [Candidatus Omnitrophota bacterium]
MALYLHRDPSNTLRFSESSDLLVCHKHAMRLYYNAQERSGVHPWKDALQIRGSIHSSGRFLLPPAAIGRLAGIKPYCPEETVAASQSGGSTCPGLHTVI